MKRSSTGTLAVALLLFLGMAAALTNLTRTGGGTSVLLLTIDTTRADHLGCYGYAKARTPALDGLAAEGALFEDAATASPLTLPSHATLFTGLLPPRHGLRDNDTPFPLPPAARRTFRTAAETFGEAGWQTAAFVSGSTLSSRWGLNAGFATWEQPPEAGAGSLHLGERDAGDTVGRALGWLGRRDRTRPFFLWVHLFDPHHPYAAPGGAGHAPDSVEAYDEEIAYADRQVGRLLDALREEGVLDRTVVVATSDHGEGLGEHGETTHGFFLHRSTTRVPLLVRAPGAVKAGIRVKEPVSLVDVTPTLYDLLQRKTAVPLDGRSLLPLASARGGEAPPPSDQYAETLYGWRSFRWAQSVAVRNGPRRIIDHGGGRREIYDLAADPGESRDLGAPPSSPGDEAAANRAWDLFRSPPLSPPEGDQPLAGAALPGYVSAFSPLQILPGPDNATLPLPSPSRLQRFLLAQRLVDRAGTPNLPGDEASALLLQAREIFRGLEEEAPGDPSVAFWMGRAFRQEGRLATQGALNPWRDAFQWFLLALRRGFKDARTVSLLMESAFQADQFGEMLTVARNADEEGLRGDSSFLVWKALAWFHGARGADRVPTTEGRSRALELLDEAEALARTEEEKEKIREVRASFR